VPNARVAHGASGKGNESGGLELTYKALGPPQFAGDAPGSDWDIVFARGALEYGGQT